jgi:TRAP-type C4-dicarboxylate transport system permease small subunit
MSRIIGGSLTLLPIILIILILDVLGRYPLKAKTIFDKFNNFSASLTKITIFIVIALAAIMVLTVLVGVFFRYVIRNSLGWTEELARYLMIWMALLSVSIGIKDKEHVGLQLLIRSIPIKYAKVVNLMVNGVVLFFLIILSYRGLTVAFRGSSQLSLGLGISMLWPLLSIPVAGLLAIIQQIIQIINIFRPGVTYDELLGTTEVEDALKEVKV